MLNNSEREKLVLDLYNQGRNVREIAQEARMAFRDIGAIVKKTESNSDDGNVIDRGNNNNKSHNEKATQAYKLFSEGKKLVEIDILYLDCLVRPYRELIY